MSGVLISTVYEKSDSTVLSIKEFNPKRLILLVDNKAKAAQLNSIKFIKKAFNNTLKIVERNVDVYDIPAVSEGVMKLIDSIPAGTEIYVDISQGRKPQAFGVLLACYARSDRIKKIVYWGGNNEAVFMPKLAFTINGNYKKLLNEVDRTANITQLIKKLKISRAQVYRYIKDLESEGLLAKENGKFALTDAGRIARV
ncbi:MAG: CRISPR locus-related DNA-binding protein [Candidatus Aenigmarchaeota archaeon]|nr:CRISPR locus-related DNA-binding protein [Candidatus Aenigmarchaeota archaeon]